MGKEQLSNYYDEIYRTSSNYVLETHAYNTRYEILYKHVKGLLDKDSKLLEIGCGTGQMAEVLIKDGYNYILGTDFSQVAIETSQKRCNVDRFKCQDIYSFDFDLDFDVIIALEFFEHIQSLKVINKIPSGKRVIFSVPSYDDPAHVIFFKDKNELYEYYKDSFADINITVLNRIFVVDAIK
jgi:2-polyprenyl-3-methyl-5-hydroxy-6-metoxy-1,4-benzoquinol methylase